MGEIRRDRPRKERELNREKEVEEEGSRIEKKVQNKRGCTTLEGHCTSRMKHCNSSFLLCVTVTHLCSEVTLLAMPTLHPHMHWRCSGPKAAGWVLALQPSLSKGGEGEGQVTVLYHSIQPACLQALPLLLTYSIVFLYLFPDGVLNTHTHESHR